MRKLLLLTFASVITLFTPVSATHIVGGEFELIHLNSYTYRLNLILYFDVINGNPGAEDDQVRPYIFRKSDNVFMDSIVLANIGSEPVPYTQPNCAIGNFLIRRITYSSTVVLPPERYDDPDGYYIAWERCCRNNVIQNVLLPQPNTVGQTFFLEFPPVVKNGQQFINSTPVLFPPLRDYACVGKPFYTPFGGEDLDGDSLVYTLADPLDSSSDIALPRITTAPYPIVPWRLPYNTQNMVLGNPALRVSKKGLLTVQPSETGLFVFAIKIEEFRAGIKIGEARRDYQMLVVDGCDFSVAPQVFAQVQGTKEVIAATDTLRFTFEENKCIDLVVTDEDPNENITFEAIPVNFEGDLADIFAASSGMIQNLNDTLRIEVCLPDCPPSKDGLMVIDLLAKDDACAVPLIDTTRLVIVIEPPPNTDPVIDPQDVVHVVDTESELYELVINATDLDDDALILDIIADGFNPEDYGMTLEELINEPGKLSSVFTWNADCKQFNLQDRNEFDLLIVVDDEDECGFGIPDTLRVKLVYEIPPNSPPEVTFNGSANNTISVDVDQPINIEVLGIDADRDSISLQWLEVDSAALLGASFTPVDGAGEVSSNFEWTPDCDDLRLNDGGVFEFKFLISDDGCFNQGADTVSLMIEINDGTFDFESFTPDNAFSPYNGDDLSQVWSIADLPVGNCDNQYVGVSIYSRWGKEVYSSNLPDFKWDGSGAPAGVYYYTLEYTNTDFKGIVYLFDADPGNF